MLSFLIHCTIKNRKRGCAMPPITVSIVSMSAKRKTSACKKEHSKATVIAS